MRLRSTFLLLGLGLATALAPPLAAQQPAAPAPTPPAAEAPPAPDAILRAAVQEMQRLSQAGQSAEAASVAERAYERLAATVEPDHPLLAVALTNLGIAQRRAGAVGEAVVSLQRALALETRLGSPQRPNFRQALRELAEAERGRGQSDNAIALYEAAITRLRQESPGTLAEAELLDEQGVLLRHTGAFARAETQLKAALAIKQVRLAPADFALATTLTNLGGVARVMGRHDDAETYYRRAIDIVAASKGDKDPNLAILIDNLGVLYSGLGRFAEAEVNHKRALGIFEQVLGHDHLSTGQCAANLGAALMQQRQYDEAEKLTQRALDIFARRLPPDDGRVGMALDNLAGIYRNQGRFAEALKAYERSLAILRKSYAPSHPEVAVALNNLALMNAEQGRLDDALRLGNEALAIVETAHGKSHIGVAQVLMNLGLIASRQGRKAEARAIYERSVAIIETELGSDHPMLVRPLGWLGEIRLSFGDAEAALAASQRAAAIEIKRRAREVSIGGDDARPDFKDPFVGVVEAAWQVEAASGKPGSRAEESLTAAQWALQNRAGLTIAQLGARVASRTPAIAELARERQDLAGEASRLDRQLTDLVSRPGPAREAGDDSALRARMGEIASRLGALDARLAKEHPLFADLALPGPITAREVRTLLTPAEALLMFLPTADHVFVWLATRNELRWTRVALPFTDLDRKVRTLRCGLDPGEWGTADKAERCQLLTVRQPAEHVLPFETATAAELYKALLGPFAPALDGKHVLVVAGGPLTNLPLQVLLTEPPAGGKLAGAKWLGHRLAMTTLPSLASLKTLRREVRASMAAKPYLGIGNPLLIGPAGDYSAAWGAQSCLAAQLKKRSPLVAPVTQVKRTQPLVRGGTTDAEEVRRLLPLPETRDELCAVAAGTGANEQDLLLGSRASEKAVRDLSASGALRAYRTLHFATHGLVAGELRGLDEAALVLTPPQEAGADGDGLLTASEIAALRLDADLVVLSACNTAAGDKLGADALSGLARSFFHAGARSMLVSHWPVQSVAAVKLTTRALGEIKKTPGLGRAEALRRSMLALASDASDPGSAHPQVWAPFVIVGEGGSGVPQTAAPLPVSAAAPAAAAAAATAARRAATKAPAGETLPWLKGKQPQPAAAAQPAKAAQPAPTVAPATKEATAPAKAVATPTVPSAPSAKAPAAAKAAPKAAAAKTPALPAEGAGIPVPPGMAPPQVVPDAVPRTATGKGTPVPAGTAQPQAKAAPPAVPLQTQSLPAARPRAKAAEPRSLPESVFGTTN